MKFLQSFLIVLGLVIIPVGCADAEVAIQEQKDTLVSRVLANDGNLNDVKIEVLFEIKPMYFVDLIKEKKDKLSRLEKFTRDNLKKVNNNIMTYWVDLNNDTIEDIFVFYTDKGLCPNSGCRTHLFMSNHEGMYNKTPYNHNSLRGSYVLKSQTNKVHDMLYVSRFMMNDLNKKNLIINKEIFLKKIWKNNKYETETHIYIDFSPTFKEE